MKPQKTWPREVIIRATVEKARSYLDPRYDEEHEGSDALLYEIGQTMEAVEIESWADLYLPAGYELDDEDDREEYRAYIKSKRRT